jgi:hypothetical protein
VGAEWGLAAVAHQGGLAELEVGFGEQVSLQLVPQHRKGSLPPLSIYCVPGLMQGAFHSSYY